VCPAEFDVGEHAKAMVYAITEGEEKPLKYPVMFRAVDAVVVNKIDLLPHLDFDLDRFLANLKAVNPAARSSRSAPAPAPASANGAVAARDPLQPSRAVSAARGSQELRRRSTVAAIGQRWLGSQVMSR
jgi:hypothetical protein